MRSLSAIVLVVLVASAAHASLFDFAMLCLGLRSPTDLRGPPPYGTDAAENLHILATYLPEIDAVIPPEGFRHWRDSYYAAPRDDPRFRGAQRATRLITLPDGTTHIGQRIAFNADRPETVREVLQIMARWQREGRGVRIEGVGLEWHAGLGGGAAPSGVLYLVTENFHAPTNALGTMVGGARSDVAVPPAVRALPVEARQWLREEILRQLDTHGDPHLGNVLYRLTRLAPGARPPTHSHCRVIGDQLLEVVSIDAGGPPAGRGSIRYLPENETFGDDVLYSRAYQRRTLGQRLGL